MLKLQGWGAKLIAISCNTAHLYFEQLQQHLDVKLLNIIHETVKLVPKNANRVSLLSTQSTFDSNLYQLAIEKVAKGFIFEPHWQQEINALIRAVKTSADSVYEEAYVLLLTLTKLKVDMVIIGCTELSEIILRVRDDQKLPMRIVDSSKALVDAVLRDSKEGD
ncbi:aspartate/glutamate racemase family protein [Cysteiniphilum sp. 6C5]|uniref:aspartate/glutamate racemase family protein n=1 Tax=unclassified Cysteiniphilum TaxID=2610889 RepID=UPI003F82B4CA